MSLPTESEPRKRLRRHDIGPAAAQRLKVPACDRLSLAEAALAYVEAGWFVFPVRPGSKVPAIENWDENSTRDPEQIRRWWTAHPDYNIALHAGRSGAIIFDADIDDLAVIERDGRSDMAAALRGAGAVHDTRREGERGHYLFAMASGEMFGNSAGAFGRYGEVRGRNGYVVVAPSVHPDADTKGGHYNWRRVGSLTPLPDVLRACLSEAAESADPLTDNEFEQFLDTHTGMGCGRDDCRKAVAGQVRWFNERVAEGSSRHEAMRDVLPWAFSESMAGCYSAREAFGTLHSAFAEAKREATSGEFYRLAQWAAAQADPERAHRNDDGPSDDDQEAFWSARPELLRLRSFARARCAGPWSTLGAVLTRAVATIPPYVVLPPTVGSHASLNLFVALVAPSGFGKGASEAVAEDFLDNETDVFVATPGSGEGILKQFAYKRRPKGQEPIQVNLRDSVLFTVSEIDTLAALGARGGSTLMPELRKAWMGERLGFGWADVEKAVALMPHRYRMTMVVGVQPGRGGALLHDGDGGTPQRFLWLPTTDRDAPDEPPAEPEPLKLPVWPSVQPEPDPETDDDQDGLRVKFGSEVEQFQLNVAPDKSAFHVLDLPPTVVEAIRMEHLAKRRGEVAEARALDSHAMLARLKVAVALMWLNGRTDKVSEEDWDLAGVVLGVSNSARASVLTAMKSNTTKAARARGRQDAVREAAKDEHLAKAEDAAIGRVAERIRKALRSENDQPKAAMQRNFGRDKKQFDAALGRLVGVGDIELKPIPGKSEAARSLHLKDGR